MLHRSAAVLAGCLFLSSFGPAAAQQIMNGDGTLLFHGNYCGPGNNGLDKAPIDELDAACRRHDLCFGDEAVTSCSCNGAFSREASAVAVSPSTEPDVAVLAGAAANGILALPCHP